MPRLSLAKLLGFFEQARAHTNKMFAKYRIPNGELTIWGKQITSKDFVDAQVVHEWCLDVWHGHPLRSLMDWYSWNS